MPTHLDRVQQIFDEVVGRPPGVREVMLAKACGGNAEFRAEVESLLEQDSQVGESFMRPPEPPSGGREPLLPDAPELRAGSKVGRYEIKRVIASGGMGTVYLAVQDKPQREVALKVMRRHVTSQSALRRFHFESHVLGHLRHPNVAQVYEAGMHGPGSAGISSAGPPSPAEDGERPSAVGLGGPTLQTATASPGVPYFAMEYIPDAKTITRYADEASLDLRERLALFAKVCDAVHHGHQKGVIHRDLKPGNILVDSGGEPKVIDFGVARATDSDLALTTMQTDVGQLIGTLQYMSPEQCDAGARDIDTRSDIYSLGVVLYELLCGNVPYDVSDTTIVRAARVIAEQSPVPPSSLDSKLRGDAETIVLKALSKDRERRYQSAGELAADVRRFLNREPITARTPTAWTRIMRWIARRPIAATTALCMSIVISALCLTVVAVWWQNIRPSELLSIKSPGREDYPQASRVQLKTRSGAILKQWPDIGPPAGQHGVGIAEFLERPAELGGGRVLVLGYIEKVDSPLSGWLWAVDADGDLDEPVWKHRVETDDILPELREHRGYTADHFTFLFGYGADVFPDRPGREIVAVFGHDSNSQKVIRIYDLAGERLYQVWHDGGLNTCYWMADAGLLVFAGDYQLPFYDEQGIIKGQKSKALVVFALRPELHLRGDEWLDATPDPDDPYSAAWFLELLPDLTFNRPIPSISILPPKHWRDRGRQVFCVIHLDAANSMAPGLHIDQDGEETLRPRVPSDDFKNLSPEDRVRLNLPHPDAIKLVPFDERKYAGIAEKKPPASQKSEP